MEKYKHTRFISFLIPALAVSIFFIEVSPAAMLKFRPIVRGRVVSFNQKYVVVQTSGKGKMRLNKNLVGKNVSLREKKYVEIDPTRYGK